MSRKQKTAGHEDKFTHSREDIEQLFINSYGEIRNRLSTSHDGWLIRVTALDVEPAIAALAKFIHEYHGPLTENEFVDWCIYQGTKAARIEALYRQFNKAVLKGVWKGLKTARDLSVEPRLARELADTAWTQFVLKDKLSELSSNMALVVWFSEMGRYQAMAWKTDQLRLRGRVSLDDGSLVTYALDDEGRAVNHDHKPRYPGPNDNLDGLPRDKPTKRGRNRKSGGASGQIQPEADDGNQLDLDDQFSTTAGALYM